MKVIVRKKGLKNTDLEHISHSKQRILTEKILKNEYKNSHGYNSVLFKNIQIK